MVANVAPAADPGAAASLAVRTSLSGARGDEQTGGVLTLWDGAMGTMGATWLGHYPWFLTYNFLVAKFPDKEGEGRFGKLVKRVQIT